MIRITKILIPILILVTCSLYAVGTPAGTDDAVQKAIQAELARWPLFHRVLKGTDDTGDVVEARWTQAIGCLAKHPEETLDSETIKSAHARLLSAEIRREFFRVLVTPQTHLEAAAVENAINDAIKINTKPASVKLLEFFSWAPQELPELRKAKKKDLEELADSMKTEDGFRKAALKFSAGASAYKGGEIGTVYQNQIPAPLWEALEATKSGLSRILSTKDGHFRFFVIQRYPPLKPTRKMLEPSIRRKMMLKESSKLADSLLSERREKLGVTIKNPTQAEDIAAVIDDQSFTLRQLLSGFSIPKTSSEIKTAISRGVDIRIMEMMLDKTGVSVRVPAAQEDATLGRRAFEKLVQTKLSERESVTKIEQTTKTKQEEMGPQPLWTFDVLRIKGVKTAKVLFKLFRIQHDAGPKVDLEHLGALITEKTGLQHSIDHFSRATNQKAASLGPEIHQELIHRAQPLLVSQPIHLEEIHQAVFVKLVKTSSMTEIDTTTLRPAARRQVELEVAEELARSLAEHCLSAGQTEPDTPLKEN